jgi:hypothetical protein
MAAAMDIDNLQDDLRDLVRQHEELADLTENSENAD